MRNALIAKIHVAKKQLAMTDEEYRDFLESLTGQRSCKDCEEHQLDSLMAAMIQLGFVPKIKSKMSPQTRDKAEHDQADKIRAMWIDLGKRGIVRVPTEPSLRRFVKRLTKVDGGVEWLSVQQSSAVIAALNAMSDDSPPKTVNTNIQ